MLVIHTAGIPAPDTEESTIRTKKLTREDVERTITEAREWGWAPNLRGSNLRGADLRWAGLRGATGLLRALGALA